MKTSCRSSKEFTFCSKVCLLIALSSANAINVGMEYLYVKKIIFWLPANTKYVVSDLMSIQSASHTVCFGKHKNANLFLKPSFACFSPHYRCSGNLDS